jgi:hypothetical protein
MPYFFWELCPAISKDLLLILGLAQQLSNAAEQCCAAFKAWVPCGKSFVKGSEVESTAEHRMRSPRP